MEQAKRVRKPWPLTSQPAHGSPREPAGAHRLARSRPCPLPLGQRPRDLGSWSKAQSSGSCPGGTRQGPRQQRPRPAAHTHPRHRSAPTSPGPALEWDVRRERPVRPDQHGVRPCSAPTLCQPGHATHRGLPAPRELDPGGRSDQPRPGRGAGPREQSRGADVHRGSPALAKRQPLHQRRQAAVEARGRGQAENADDHVDCGGGGGEGPAPSGTDPPEAPARARGWTHPGGRRRSTGAPAWSST